jgi:hypothetical protein
MYTKGESLNDELKYSEDSSAAAILEFVKTKEKESKNTGADCFPSFDLGVLCVTLYAGRPYNKRGFILRQGYCVVFFPRLTRVKCTSTLLRLCTVHGIRGGLYQVVVVAPKKFRVCINHHFHLITPAKAKHIHDPYRQF